MRNSYWEFPSFGNQHTNIEIIVMSTQNINDIMQILNDRNVRRECQIGKRKQKKDQLQIEQRPGSLRG